ncbi:MAG TPA: aspartate 1-decarboxylase [Bdellovibrionales bacterium]|nr:aspartate 1-decarboxylase [Bdellovibrionales bacterium]
MRLNLLKSKIHRATVTDADLNYEGSVSIDPKLCDAARLIPFERVEIYNCNNGERFATYVIHGKPGEICLNGAAARKVHKGDLVIIASYADFEQEEALQHKPQLVMVDAANSIKKIHNEYEGKL